MKHLKNPKEFIIRPYSPADRDAVRRICCETGFSGDPVDPLFSDRDVFADFFTRYYTDWEPESAWVAEIHGEVIGYLIGCIRYRYYKWIDMWILASVITPKVIARLLTGRYNAQSRKFLWWSCLKAPFETPPAPKEAAHFHVNLLPEYRTSGAAHQMFYKFMNYLEEQKIKRVYAQIQTRDDRRSERAFRFFGFRIVNQKPVSKFQDFHNETVYVTTVVIEFDRPAES